MIQREIKKKRNYVLSATKTAVTVGQNYQQMLIFFIDEFQISDSYSSYGTLDKKKTEIKPIMHYMLPWNTAKKKKKKKRKLSLFIEMLVTIAIDQQHV